MKSVNDYYKILGLDDRASAKELKKAYRGLVRKWHPDQFSRDPQRLNGAKEKLQEINEAYHALQRHIAEPNKSSPQSAGKPSRPTVTEPRKPSPAGVGSAFTPFAVFSHGQFAPWRKHAGMLRRVFIETLKDPWIIAAVVLMLVLAIALDWFY